MFWLTLTAIAAVALGTALSWYGSTRDGNVNQGGSGVLIAVLGAVIFIVGVVAFVVDLGIRIYTG